MLMARIKSFCMKNVCYGSKKESSFPDFYIESKQHKKSPRNREVYSFSLVGKENDYSIFLVYCSKYFLDFYAAKYGSSNILSVAEIED